MHSFIPCNEKYSQNINMETKRMVQVCLYKFIEIHESIIFQYYDINVRKSIRLRLNMTVLLNTHSKYLPNNASSIAGIAYF